MFFTFVVARIDNATKFEGPLQTDKSLEQDAIKSKQATTYAQPPCRNMF